jgi:threonine/homoserine/homoserine lactone efflux protein
MDVLAFIVTVIFVTASGALSPGPLFFAAISHGTKSGAKGGFLFAIGHTLVEFPLVMLLALGLLTAANQPTVKYIIGVLGGVALLIFGALQIRQSLSLIRIEELESGIVFRNPLFLGIIFTGLNPYFIIWWLTAGGKLIMDSLVLASLTGVLLMYVSHVWMDYVWLTGIAHLAEMGAAIVSTKGYRIISVIFGIILFYFGITFLFSTFS